MDVDLFKRDRIPSSVAKNYPANRRAYEIFQLHKAGVSGEFVASFPPNMPYEAIIACKENDKSPEDVSKYPQKFWPLLPTILEHSVEAEDLKKYPDIHPALTVWFAAYNVEPGSSKMEKLLGLDFKDTSPEDVLRSGISPSQMLRMPSDLPVCERLNCFDGQFDLETIQRYRRIFGDCSKMAYLAKLGKPLRRMAAYPSWLGAFDRVLLDGEGITPREASRYPKDTDGVTIRARERERESRERERNAQGQGARVKRSERKK
jgi:hypothetical protein